MAGTRACWQHVHAHLRDADLVVLSQENSLLSNYPLLFAGRSSRRVAFWGHGANFQRRSAARLSEALRRWTAQSVDWWFGDTVLSVDAVVEAGFPRERITQLDNAADTLTLRDECASISEEEVNAARTALGLGSGFTAVALGSLYPERRIDFLLEACDQLVRTAPDFQLIVIGAGPEAGKVERAATTRPWCRYLGPQVGRPKALYLAMADVMLNPGVVGLGILDAFASVSPLITTACPGHGPEIAYLEEDNGVMTADDVPSFVEACLRLRADSSALERLRDGCRSGAARYTLERTVGNFADGIRAALAAPPYRGGGEFDDPSMAQAACRSRSRSSE